MTTNPETAGAEAVAKRTAAAESAWQDFVSVGLGKFDSPMEKRIFMAAYCVGAASLPAASEGEVLLPANPRALSMSIEIVDRFMNDDDSHVLHPEVGESIMLVVHELKRLQARPAPEPKCFECGDSGEVFGHADDCDNDSCALNGDIDSCLGMVEPCGCAEPQAPATGGDAARDVIAERARQVEAEGWRPDHDDAYRNGFELARAAACYALADAGGASGPFWITALQVPQQVWPYRWEWKPSVRRRNLVKAGALILAEIERLDRADLNPADAEGGRADA